MKLFHSKIPETSFGNVAQVLDEGILGFGPRVLEFEERFASYSGKTNNIAVNSASAAAFIIFAYLYEKHGPCNVYTTSLGFASPAWAAKHLGHNLIFVDTNDQLLLDSTDYRTKRVQTYTNATTVVMPVLYGGISTIDDWNLLGDEIIVTDSAHGPTPTLQSDFVFFSFHPYKPICTSDGGMISTDDKTAAAFFRSYRNFGRESTGSSYDLVQNGFKFYMNNLNATLGLISLDSYENDLRKRKRNLEFIASHCPYQTFLKHDQNSSYYFGTILDDAADQKMDELGIQRNYPLLHKTTHFRTKVKLEYIEGVHNKILNVPIHQHLTMDEKYKIIEVLNG